MKPIISVEHLRKMYIMGKTQVNALQDITLDVFKNEYVALMGPSGSGSQR